MFNFTKSSVYPKYISSEGVVNGRWVVEVLANPDDVIGHPAGTMVCEPSDADDSMTFTAKNGNAGTSRNANR